MSTAISPKPRRIKLRFIVFSFEID